MMMQLILTIDCGLSQKLISKFFENRPKSSKFDDFWPITWPNHTQNASDWHRKHLGCVQIESKRFGVAFTRCVEMNKGQIFFENTITASGRLRYASYAHVSPSTQDAGTMACSSASLLQCEPPRAIMHCPSLIIA